MAFTKKITFSILEDYDKGENLKDVEADFLLFRELGISQWRGSFGWDDYEPDRGKYDFKWLKEFIQLAASKQIELRPYIGYTPEWAAKPGGVDENYWNNPPANLEDWRTFISHLISSIGNYENILSFEIYNEENAASWWDGSISEYVAVLNSAADAMRSAGWKKGIVLGGMTHPDLIWLEDLCNKSPGPEHFNAVPFHAYPELWNKESVETYLNSFQKQFVPSALESCEKKEFWINEMGFPTTPGKHSEIDQANWWARAIATYASLPHLEHFGIYEIKEQQRSKEIIGEQENYFLGITYANRKKKLAFYTLRTIIALLNTGKITVADHEVKSIVISGKAGELYRHLFIRPDGKQILFIWDKVSSPVVNLILSRDAKKVTEFFLDGRSADYKAFTKDMLKSVKLSPGNVRIFEIDPH